MAPLRPYPRAASVTAEAGSEERWIGATLGRYRLDALLGRGNRAAVYRATSLLDGGLVAVRVLDQDLVAAPAFRARFQAAVTALAAMRHPHLLPILDHGEQDGVLYLVRPYVAGDTLRQRVGVPLPLDEAITLLRPIADALDHAHTLGFVHGDLKPGHILLPASGQALLADLGLAPLLPGGNSLVAVVQGRHYGTPEYLAPELVGGAAPGARADLYALGVILYELLTGRLPFQAADGRDSARAIAMAQLGTTPAAVSSLNPTLPAGTDAALLRALAKDPTARYPSATALLDALAALVAPPVQRTRRERALMVGLTLVAALLLALSLTGWSGTAAQRRAEVALDARLAEVARLPQTQMEGDLQRFRQALLSGARTPAMIGIGGGTAAQARWKTAVDEELVHLDTLFPGMIDEACRIDQRGVELSRVSGRVVAPMDDLSDNESANPFFRPTLALREGGVHYQLPYVSPDTARWVLAATTPLFTEGQPTGLLHFEVPLAYYHARLRAAAPPGGFIALVDAEGRVYLDTHVAPPTDGEFSRVGEFTDERRVGQSATQPGDSGAGYTTWRSGGATYRASYQRVQLAPGYTTTIVVGLPSAPGLLAQLTAFAPGIVAGGLIVLVIVLLLARRSAAASTRRVDVAG